MLVIGAMENVIRRNDKLFLGPFNLRIFDKLEIEVGVEQKDKFCNFFYVLLRNVAIALLRTMLVNVVRIVTNNIKLFHYVNSHVQINFSTTLPGRKIILSLLLGNLFEIRYYLNAHNCDL